MSFSIGKKQVTFAELARRHPPRSPMGRWLRAAAKIVEDAPKQKRPKRKRRKRNVDAEDGG